MRIIPIKEHADPSLAPDLVWDGIMSDLALAEIGEIGNRNGLRARAHLETAVLICLMTDARASQDELRTDDINRGWPGDSFDIDTAAGEAPIGSKLWLLLRRTVDEVHVPKLAEDYAREALQPLIDQGAVAAITVAATGYPSEHRLELAITLTDRAGAVLIAPNYSILWENLHGIRVYST